MRYLLIEFRFPALSLWGLNSFTFQNQKSRVSCPGPLGRQFLYFLIELLLNVMDFLPWASGASIPLLFNRISIESHGFPALGIWGVNSFTFLLTFY